MLKSDADLESRMITLMDGKNLGNLDKLKICCILGIDVMQFLRNKTDDMELCQHAKLNVNVVDGVEIVEQSGNWHLVLKSNGSRIDLPCDLFYEQGLLLFYFTDKGITYHTLLVMCEVIGIPYGEVVPSMCNSWTE